MSDIPPAEPFQAPVPVQPLEYRRANDLDRPPEPSTRRQVWLGIGLWLAYLLWSFASGRISHWMFFGFGYFGYYGEALGYRVIAVLPLLAATLYVMSRRNWGPSAVAVLLVGAWVSACSGSRMRGDPITLLWTMIPPVGTAVYLLAIRRYRGVAAGLFIALGLTVLSLAALFFVVSQMIGR